MSDPVSSFAPIYSHYPRRSRPSHEAFVTPSTFEYIGRAIPCLWSPNSPQQLGLLRICPQQDAAIAAGYHCHVGFRSTAPLWQGRSCTRRRQHSVSGCGTRSDEFKLTGTSFSHGQLADAFVEMSRRIDADAACWRSLTMASVFAPADVERCKDNLAAHNLVNDKNNAKYRAAPRPRKPDPQQARLKRRDSSDTSPGMPWTASPM